VSVYSQHIHQISQDEGQSLQSKY